jgi:hypothetical protein
MNMDDYSLIGLAILVLWGIAASLFTAFVAEEKRRGFGAWFWLAIFFSPLIALLALAALPVGNGGKLEEEARAEYDSQKQILEGKKEKP